MDDPGSIDDQAAAPESPPQTEVPSPPPLARKRGSFFKELPVLILLAFALAILVKTFMLQAFFIPSESMVPTLQVGDRVLVNKIVYHLHEPRRGDIIVFIAHRGAHRSFWQRVRSVLFEGLGVTHPSDVDFIKRVIALPGETIQVKHGVVYITPRGGGTPFTLDEPYLSPVKDISSYGPRLVPAGEFFVMGDNRTNSADSRTELGPIPRNEIVGRAFIRIWPLGRLGFFHRPHYTALGPSSMSGDPPAGYIRERGTRREARTAAA